MPVEMQTITKMEILADKLNMVRWFFILPFMVLYRFFKGKTYYDPKRK